MRGRVWCMQDSHYKIEDRLEVLNMKTSVCRSYDELPLFLNASLVSQVLGVSVSTAYELMHEPSFPVLRVGSRMMVPKEKFIRWTEQHTSGGANEV